MVLLKDSPHELQWVKFGSVKNICFVGKDVLCIGGNVMISFYNVTTGNEIIYKASGGEVGEGVHALTGHSSFSVFAFAECCTSPNIFIKTYPDFLEVCSLSDGTNGFYTEIRFSDHDFLISLDGIPDFIMTVWNWRSGEKVANVETKILSENQILRCSTTTPVTVAQVEQHGNKLLMWDILMCGSQCILKDHTVRGVEGLEITSILWTTEGGLFVLDIQGNLFTVTTDYKLELVLPWEGFGVHPTYLHWLKGGFVIAGPTGELKHFKKTGEYSEIWSITPPEPFKRLLTSQKETLVGVSQSDNTYLFDAAEMQFIPIKKYERQFDDVCLVYPMGEMIVTLSHKRELVLWEVSSGELVDFLELPGVALYIETHKTYPYVGITFDHGLLLLVSICDRKFIRKVSIHLTRNPLTKLYFAEFVPLIVACDTNVGQFFVLEGLAGSKPQVIATATADAQIVDFILIASQTCFRIFAIVVTSDIHLAGCKFIRLCIIKGRPKVEIKAYDMQKTYGILYERIYASKAENRDRVFYAMPYTRKDLHEIEVKRGDNFAKITKKIQFNHQMRKITLNTDDYHCVSYAYDGLVIIRSIDWTQQYAAVMTHHRRYAGVLKAYIDPLRKFIISLGRDNCLVCLFLINTPDMFDVQSQITTVMESNETELICSSEMTIFPPPGPFEDKTWLEIEQIKIREKERILCEKERKSIIQSFKLLKKEIRHLLTKNIEGPDNEKLDIQEFNLDDDTKTILLYNNEEECIFTKKYLEDMIQAQDKISNWIKDFCWNKMSEQGKAIWAIFGNFDVQNYVLLPNDGEVDELEQWLEEQRAIEILLSCEDSFEPWLPRPKEVLKEHLAKEPLISLSLPTPATALFLTATEEEEEQEIEITLKNELDMETITAFSGSLVHTFVTVEKVHYTQPQIQSFAQVNIQKLLSQKENSKLKLFFNKEFENLMSQKVREINNVVERNEKLRYYLSEFNYFSEEKLDIIVVDPEWKQEEDPDLIIKVDDSEVGCLPYISPSEQAILDAIAAEEERLRLLMLADDFRERALYAMMWGVLEIRWEDELRKEVPQPKCMLEKEPENYNEDDLRAIRDYEEKVKFLMSERERYKKILTVDYAKLGNVLREGVKKFNGRLNDLLLLKIRVDSAISQENLKIARLRLACQNRITMNLEEMNAGAEIKRNDKEIETLSKTIASLNESLGEIRSQIDAQQTKEKNLDRNFKKEFGEVSPVALEQINRIYKKRPKVHIRGVNSSSLYLELAKCLISHEKSAILTTECLEFLKAMDNLDLYAGVSNAVDEHLYANVCRHRRLKVESEIKVKALNIELAEAEHTISIFHKLLTQKKEQHSKFTSNLAQIRSDKIKNSQNIEIQMIIKQGFVEVPTTGNIEDFKNVILVSKSDVAEINKIIVKVGNRKLKIMREIMEFRRGILAMEWEHKRLKMKIFDLKEYLKDIYSVRVTKEIQAYLKSKARGGTVKELTFEEEIELIKKSYERMIEERKRNVKELRDKIRAMKYQTSKLNETISNINVDVCEFKLEVDEELEQKEKDIIRIRMATLLKRAKLVKAIQENHNEILVLQTELELLRLKTYPTLKFKVIS